MVTREREDRMAGRLRAALGGDAMAYKFFLEEAASIVRRLAQKKLGPGNAIDPEDIVQDTLLALHLKRHTWRRDAPLLPWLYAIARYKIIDAFRRRGRRVEVDISEFIETLPADEVEKAMPHEIERALDGLSSGQRRVVSAIGIEGLTIAETAATLDMKETAVRVAFHRGLAAITQRFEGS